MCGGRAARTVGSMVNPTIREELLRAAEADLARRMRHAHHTSELPPTVLACLTARVRNVQFKRRALERSVAGRRNLRSTADAADNA
jgi:hypothetical protein